SYLYSGFDLPMATPAYELKNLYLYSYNVYVKPTRFFDMLAHLIGYENFTTVLQTYYQHWKFKHVTGQRLQKICEQVAQQDLDWFFHQWLYDTPKVDYACANIASHQINENTWRTNVIVQRLGNGVVPLDALIFTDDGDSFKQRWFCREAADVYNLTTRHRVKTVQLDPDDVMLDQNRLNNGRFRVLTYLYPDFPSMYYLPRDAYSVFFWPRGWYNDIDGFKIGLNVLGSYLNRYYISRNYLWYGFKSRELDFNFGYSTPVEFINRNLWCHLSALKFEGRSELHLNLNYNFYEQFASPRLRAIHFGFIHQQLFAASYAFRRYQLNDGIINIREWDRGNVNRFYINFRSNCSHIMPESNIEFLGQISHRLWQSDYNYHRLSLEYKFQLGQQLKNWRVSVRTFAGYSSGAREQLPLQHRFWIAEANPQQRFRYFYLSSLGAMPVEAHYHFPGDGNLRGYTTKLTAESTPLTAGSLVTANFEILYRNAQAVLPQASERWFQGITVALFLDAGRLWNTTIDQRFLFDAGVGLRFYKKLLGKQKTFRIDFPLWLSQPNLSPLSPAETPWKFRWVLSLQ
ncbi:MAG: M1 family aminopeptidase, partial [candidate division KSB1 bacterium]|nr:M1 family aminopeptidase [candidate division KSB1 bacterium]